jgi:single-strand DNA-binding protein
MSGSLNKVSLIGHLGKDPEIRRTQDGRAIANLSLATSESWTDKQSGEKREKTEWHRVVCFNEKLSEIMEKYLKKGSKVYIEGKLQTRKWTDKDKIDRYSTEVVLQGFDGKLVMLSAKESGREERSNGASYNGQGDTAKPSHAVKGSTHDDMDDAIPF